MSAANQGFGSMRHLAARFFVSLRPGGPPAADDAWAEAQLLPGEAALWRRMSGPDRRHAIGVARDAIVDLASARPAAPTAGPGVRTRALPAVPRPVVAAALLHDVGKLDSGLGTWARAGVTIVSMVAGRDRVAAWAPAPAGGGRPVFPGRLEGVQPPKLAPASASPDRPAGGRGLRVAAGRYVTHDRLGAALLQAAGSDPLTVAWAGEHHLPEDAWTVDRRVADALKAADGD